MLFTFPKLAHRRAIGLSCSFSKQVRNVPSYHPLSMRFERRLYYRLGLHIFNAHHSNHRIFVLSLNPPNHAITHYIRLQELQHSRGKVDASVSIPSTLALWVSCSASVSRNPSGDRKPTIIFGTPRRNDCAQNLSSFRSYFTSSRWVAGCCDVLSSIQGIGSAGLSGLAPMTASTSPARIRVVGPILVVTMEQYWALLLTMMLSLSSISARVVSAQGLGMTERCSNL
jgi:hypothetical protein